MWNKELGGSQKGQSMMHILTNRVSGPILLCLVALLSCTRSSDAKYLGFAEDADRYSGPLFNGSRLKDMTAVATVSREEYRSMQSSARAIISKNGWLYFAVDVHRDIPSVDGNPGFWYTEVQRFKTAQQPDAPEPLTRPGDP